MYQLTQSYYLNRIAKSKDATDLTDALNALAAYKKNRLELSAKQFALGLFSMNPVLMTEALLLPLQ